MPEVGELGQALPVDEDVGGLDVPVDDAGVVDDLEGPGHLGQDRQDLGGGQGALLGDDVGQGAALDELHDEPAGAVLLTGVQDDGEVGVTQTLRVLGLRAQTGQEDLVPGQLGTQDLGRHRPTRAQVGGTPHLPHATQGDLLHELVAALELESCDWLHWSTAASMT